MKIKQMFIKLLNKVLDIESPSAMFNDPEGFAEGFRDGLWIGDLRYKCGLPLEPPSEQIRQSARAAMFFDSSDEEE